MVQLGWPLACWGFNRGSKSREEGSTEKKEVTQRENAEGGEKEMATVRLPMDSESHKTSQEMSKVQRPVD